MTSALPFTLAALLLSAPPQPPAPPPPPPDPAKVLARVATGEPSIGAVQDAAAREVERAVADPSDLARRRRLAALLPRLTAELRVDEQRYRITGLQAAGEVDYLRSSPGSSVLLRATWELGDLVASTGEPAAASFSLTRARRREEAVRRATALFFERRRLAVLLALDPPSDPRGRAEAELEVQRVTADLDALTGGLFGGWGRP